MIPDYNKLSEVEHSVELNNYIMLTRGICQKYRLRGTDFLHKLVSMTGQDSNTIVALSEASLVSTIQRYVWRKSTCR